MKKYLVLAAMAATLVAPGAAHAKRYNLIMTYGQDILVAGKDDDVAIRAQCIQNDMGTDVLRVYAKVGHNSVMKGGLGGFQGNGFYLTAATPAAGAAIAAVGATTGNEQFGTVIDGGFLLNLTTMHGYAFTVESTILGLNSGGNDCILSINLDAVKKFKAVE